MIIVFDLSLAIFFDKQNTHEVKFIHNFIVFVLYINKNTVTLGKKKSIR